MPVNRSTHEPQKTADPYRGCRSVLALGANGARAAQAAQEPLPKIEESNPTAAALSYVHDATTSPKRTTEEQKKQYCDNCIHYKATEGAAEGADAEGEGWGTCAVLPGFLVAAKGWCMVWVAQPPPPA